MFHLPNKKIGLGLALVATLATVAVARQYHGVGELDCEPLVAAGSTTPLAMTATGPNTGTVTVSSLPLGVISWSGTPSWDSNNHATVNVSVSPNYTGFVYITAGANGQSASASTLSLVLDL